MANTAHVMRSPVMIHFSWIQQSQYGKCKGQMTWIFLGAQRLHHITTIHQNNIGWKFHIMRIVKQFWVSTTFFLETQHTSQISQINVLHNTKTLQRVKRFSHGVESSWVIRMHIVSGAQQCRTQNTAPDAASSCWFSP